MCEKGQALGSSVVSQVWGSNMKQEVVSARA
jgi:hypothetical protein